MPRSPDLAIFVLTTRQTKPIALPLAHARGVTSTCSRQLGTSTSRILIPKPIDGIGLSDLMHRLCLSVVSQSTDPKLIYA